jgi:hypothetical protein
LVGFVVFEWRKSRLLEWYFSVELGSKVFKGFDFFSFPKKRKISDRHQYQMASLVFGLREQLSRPYAFEGDESTLTFLYFGVNIGSLSYDDAFKWSRFERGRLRFWD